MLCIKCLPSIFMPDNKVVSRLHEVLLEVEYHLRTNIQGGDPSTLDLLTINIISNHLVQLLDRGKEVTIKGI